MEKHFSPFICHRQTAQNLPIYLKINVNRTWIIREASYIIMILFQKEKT